MYRDISEDYRRDLVSMRSKDRVLFGHFCFSLHKLLGDEQPQYMTVIRNPVDRVVSWYKHQLRDVNLPLNKRIVQDRLSLGEIIKLGLAPEVNNHSVRMICADYRNNIFLDKVRDAFSATLLRKQYHQFTSKRHLVGAMANIGKWFAFVGTIEHLAELRSFLIAERKVPPETVPPIRRENESEPIQLEIDSQTLLLIKNANELDLALYENFAGNHWSRSLMEEWVLPRSPLPGTHSRAASTRLGYSGSAALDKS